MTHRCTNPFEIFFRLFEGEALSQFRCDEAHTNASLATLTLTPNITALQRVTLTLDSGRLTRSHAPPMDAKNSLQMRQSGWGWCAGGSTSVVSCISLRKVSGWIVGTALRRVKVRNVCRNQLPIRRSQVLHSYVALSLLFD